MQELNGLFWSAGRFWTNGSERQSEISTSDELVVDVFQEGQLSLKQVHRRLGDVFTPGDVQSPQTFAVLHQDEQGPEGGGKGQKVRMFSKSSRLQMLQMWGLVPPTCL